MGYFHSMRVLKGATKDLPKLFKVLLSCNTLEHYETAEQYCLAYMEKHSEAFMIFGRGENNIFFQLFTELDRYIVHSKDHSKSGSHEKDGIKCTVWPDLNDYIGPVFDINPGFPKVWTLKWSRQYCCK